MDAAIVVSLVMSVASAVALGRTLWSLVQAARHWRRRSRGLPLGRRRRAARTMLRGEPLLDSDDARLAIAVADHAEREALAVRPLHRVSVPVGSALILLGLAGGAPALAMGGVAGLAVSGLVVVTSSRRLRPFRRALASTRELAGTTSASWSG